MTTILAVLYFAAICWLFRKAWHQSDAADVQQTNDLEQFRKRMQSRRGRTPLRFRDANHTKGRES